MKLRALTGIGCLALCAIGCQRAGSVVNLETQAAERQRIERVVVATGTIEPQSEVEVRPRLAGIVDRILVNEGDRVEENQVLLEIDHELLLAQVREAEATLRSAQVERRYAKIERDRLDKLSSQGASSMRDLDRASSRYETARAAIARTEAALESLKVQLRYATVRSPLSGRVLAVHVEEGNAVSQVTAVTGGSLLFSLAATDSLHLRGLVDENEIARVELGQPARVRTEAYGERLFEGRVNEISPMGERVQNVTYFEVEIEITDAEAGLLRPRMSGDADIVTEVVENALVVPETALRYAGGTIFVEIVRAVEPLDLEHRDVEVGIVDGEHVQVVQGLQEGEEVRLP